MKEHLKKEQVRIIIVSKLLLNETSNKIQNALQICDNKCCKRQKFKITNWIRLKTFTKMVTKILKTLHLS